MSDRAVACFRCGGEGHISRNCTQCTTLVIQLATLAITAVRQDTSQENVLNKDKTTEGPNPTTPAQI